MGVILLQALLLSYHSMSANEHTVYNSCVLAAYLSKAICGYTCGIAHEHASVLSIGST